MAGLRVIPEYRQGTGHERYTSPHLSDYAGSKIAVACEKCGLQRRYDASALLQRTGDRALPDLLRIIAIGEKCGRVDNDWNDRCTLHYKMSISYQPERDARLR